MELLLLVWLLWRSGVLKVLHPRFLSVPFLAVNFKLCIGPLSEPPGKAETRSEVCTPICVPLGRSLTFPRIGVLVKEVKTSIFSPRISTGLWLTSLAMTGEKSIFVQRSPFDFWEQFHSCYWRKMRGPAFLSCSGWVVRGRVWRRKVLP